MSYIVSELNKLYPGGLNGVKIAINDCSTPARVLAQTLFAAGATIIVADKQIDNVNALNRELYPRSGSLLRYRAVSFSTIHLEVVDVIIEINELPGVPLEQKIEFDLKQKLSLARSRVSKSSYGNSIYYDKNNLLSNGLLFLNSEITDDYAGEMMMNLQEIALMQDYERPEEIVYFINSPGGSIPATLQIIDAIRQMPIPVVTYGMGYVASGAIMLLMSGHTRVATDNTMIMSHQFSAGIEGKHHELAADHKATEITNNIMLRRYKMSTKKSLAYIRKHLLPPHDVTMTADEALRHGIIDQVVKIP